MPANAREERERSCVTKVVPHITVSPGCPGLLIPRFNRHYEQLCAAQLPYDHSANHIAESHLETLLGSPIGRGAEVALLKMSAEDRGQEDEGNRDGEGYGSPHNHHRHPHHPQQDKLVTNRDLMDTPLSPISTKVSAVPEVQGMVSMTFSETPWETMEWLDLTPPSSATAFSVAPPSGPSIFNTEFLDVTDINLNSAMDLHLEHWWKRHCRPKRWLATCSPYAVKHKDTSLQVAVRTAHYQLWSYQRTIEFWLLKYLNSFSPSARGSSCYNTVGHDIK